MGLALTQGDVKKVTDDVAALKPSIFAAVPRVLDRMKSGIEAKIKRQPGWKQGLFRVAYNLKRFMRRLGRFDFVSHWRMMYTYPVQESHGVVNISTASCPALAAVTL